MDAPARGCSWSAAPSGRSAWRPPGVCPRIFFCANAAFAPSTHRADAGCVQAAGGTPEVSGSRGAPRVQTAVTARAPSCFCIYLLLLLAACRTGPFFSIFLEFRFNFKRALSARAVPCKTSPHLCAGICCLGAARGPGLVPKSRGFSLQWEGKCNRKGLCVEIRVYGDLSGCKRGRNRVPTLSLCCRLFSRRR